MADFTSRFNELLNRYSGSDSELAEVFGVSKQAISAWKNGVRSPKRPTIRIIADFFGVGVPWLNGITDDESETGFDVLSREFNFEPSPVKKLREIGDDLSPGSSNPALSEVLQIFDGLNERGRDSLLNYARFLNSDPAMKRDGASNTAMV